MTVSGGASVYRMAWTRVASLSPEAHLVVDVQGARAEPRRLARVHERLVVRGQRPHAQRLGDVALGEPLRAQQPAGLDLELEERGAGGEEPPVVPGRPPVLRADAGAAEERLPAARVLLRDVVEEELPVVQGDGVGREGEEVDDPARAEGQVGGEGHADVDLDDFAEPALAPALPRLGLEPLRGRDRLPQGLLRVPDLGLQLLLAVAELQVVAEGVLEEAEVEPALAALVEELRLEEEEGGQAPRRVVLPDPLRQRRQVALRGDLVGHRVGLAPDPPGVVVDPEDVVVARLVERAHELELEARAVRGEDGVAPGEGTPEGPRDDRVDVLLRVLLLRPEREVERHPDLALVPLVVLLQGVAGPLEHPRDLVEHAERRLPARGVEARCRLEGTAECPPARLREPGERVGLLESPDEPVVRQQHLVEQDLGRPVRHRAALLGPDRAREGGVEGLVVVPGLEGVRAPLGVEGVLLLEEALRRLDVGPELLHRLEVARVVVVVEEVRVQDEPAPGVAERLGAAPGSRP